ncbi:MAG: hypothetical protein VX790_00910, partial [Bacteroidota bacterium]|nr:hypothetical protein [Bacteroidota bacterium]
LAEILKEEHGIEPSNYLWFNDTRTFHSFDRKLWGLRFGNDFSTQNLMVFEADFAYSSKTRDYDKPKSNNSLNCSKS